MNYKLNDNAKYNNKKSTITNSNYEHDNKKDNYILSSLFDDIMKNKKNIILTILFLFIMSFLISFACTFYVGELANEGIQKRKTEDRLRDINDYRAAHNLPLIRSIEDNNENN